MLKQTHIFSYPTFAKSLALGLCLTLATPLAAHAVGDPMVDGARQCTQYFPAEEQRNGIPAHLLAAISSTESGRWHKNLGLALPWPWTINVEGKGYYFDTKAEAIARVAALKRQGVRSIDVGCMQVSLLHHPNAFANLDQAFDPATNVAYGAKFLRENYDDLHDWVKATAAYHSRTPVYGKQYLGMIEKSWNRIVSKVQEARNSQGMQPAAIDAPKFSTTPLPAGPMASAQNGAVSRTVSGVKVLTPVTTASNNGLRGLRDTHNVRIIQVSDSEQPTTRRAADTMVVRANEAQAAPHTPVTNVKIADARDSSTDMFVRNSDSVRQVRIDSGLSASDTAARSGTSAPARFVFAN